MTDRLIIEIRDCPSGRRGEEEQGLSEGVTANRAGWDIDQVIDGWFVCTFSYVFFRINGPLKKIVHLKAKRQKRGHLSRHHTPEDKKRHTIVNRHQKV